MGSNEEIIHAIEEHRASLVAIDAPLTLPAGLHCLGESCPCSSPTPFRSAELELRRLGFGLFYTTKKSIIKAVVYRGMALKGELERQGYSVLEVYPYASRVRLWGQRPPRKTTPQGLAFLREKLAALLPSLAPHLPGLTHDLADAAIAAYTAYLHFRGQCYHLGGPEEGTICIPKAELFRKSQ